VLFYIGDLSVEQAAAAMEISEGAVKASLHSARKNLSRSLEVTDDTR
jgi:DNA-directed RNA polymerase specialized sigma24 family protein